MKVTDAAQSKIIIKLALFKIGYNAKNSRPNKKLNK